ncbi:ribbon-helix-helix protein, CopG family [Leucobacter sp. wl10]|uniref:ribbon-helix-helix protein, CopG family n=1 Tax=Leucobacter sp. wl10 TaxID=2304677 RepID=UPI000E5A9EB3|nr:ribbon-helix-helix protein, CopG family [Leucobacter sp. wl10]RGE20757.1 ribbon-helix-helix protein, CopG family [Leucobacter sp. wl10]
MATLEKRVQVLFDPERYAALEAEARIRGVSVGAFIREAVDERVNALHRRKTEILERMLARADAAPQDPLPDWNDLKADYEREMDPLHQSTRNNGEAAA